jgi:uncharacterized protein YjbJ (UPF0337 family)
MLTQEELQGNWKQLTGKIKETWGQISDQELKQAQGNVEQLVGLIQQKTGQTRADIENRLHELSEQGASMARHATESARQTAQQVREQAMRRYSEAEDMVRQHPTESVAVAFGTGLIAGILVGLLTRSR